MSNESFSSFSLDGYFEQGPNCLRCGNAESMGQLLVERLLEDREDVEQISRITAKIKCLGQCLGEDTDDFDFRCMFTMDVKIFNRGNELLAHLATPDNGPLDE